MLVLVALVISLVCSASCMPPNGSLRIVDGPSDVEGRIEVFYDGEWGTICDDGFHYTDANVICRQLGYERASAIFYRATYGEGTGPIWIDQLACRSSDESILDCRHNGWGISDCRHREDAGIRCKRVEPVKPSLMPVRLSCPKCNPEGSCKSVPSKPHPGKTECLPQTAVEGVVEALYNGQWLPVSAEGFDEDAARVVCGELGYPYAVGPPSLTELWENWNYTVSDLLGESASLCNLVDAYADTSFQLSLQRTWLKRLSCTGRESRLLHCYFSEFGPTVVAGNLTSPPEVAIVRCGFHPHKSCYSDNVERYRTHGSAVKSQGRIEMYHDGEWGTICDSQWDLPDASVACRSMGYGSARAPANRAYFGRGVGKIHFSAMKCKGSEQYLSECEHQEAGYACTHAGDAGVICNHPVESEVIAKSALLDTPHPQNPGHIRPFVELDGPAGWGLLCFIREQLSLSAARVICRSDRDMFEFRIRSSEHPDYTGPRYYGNLDCTGDEDTIAECGMQLSTVRSCAFGETVVDCSPTLPDLVADLQYFERSLRYYPYVDRLPLYYIECALEENCLSSSAYEIANPQYSNDLRYLLRFDSRTMNYGRIDFRPTGDISEWEWHSCHRHYHSFEAFIHYDLLNATTRARIAEGHKASFCLEDSSCEHGIYPRYRCGTGSQGISVNCGDLYGRHLDCQWIDITDHTSNRPEQYLVTQRVNPDRLTSESDYENNNMECLITIYPGNYLAVNSCKYSDK